MPIKSKVLMLSLPLFGFVLCYCMQPMITAFVGDDESESEQQIVKGVTYVQGNRWQGKTKGEEGIVIEGEIFGESFLEQDSAGELFAPLPDE